MSAERRGHGARVRQRQAERRLSVRTERRATPDVRKLSRAFIGLALARAQAEADAAAEQETHRHNPQRAGDDDR